MKEAEQEIEGLKQYIVHLQSHLSVYVAVKGDHIDEALAKYINEVADKSKLKVIFIRLSPGIYQFGSKKVCVRVEQGKINIRVGGGFLQIEEFLDQYTTIELEKSIREGIDPMGGENSPIKVPGILKGDLRQSETGRSPSPKKLLQKVRDV
jgi:Growth-Arrest-Specific Protein 2 Domain